MVAPAPLEERVVTSPPAGKRVRFVETPDDPESDPLVFEMWLDADGSHGPMYHVHPRQREWFEVRSGRLGVHHDGTTATYGPGERVEIPAGDPHRFHNAGSTRLHLEGGVDPGLRTEAFMRITYGLARDGEPVTPSGALLNPLKLAVVLDRYDDMLFLARVPVAVQLLGVRLLAPVGRLVGYDDSFPEYLDG